MPRRPSPTRRWAVAATWPVGVALTSWDYMWRITPLHRSETSAPPPRELAGLLRYPSHLSAEEVQGERDGHGPLFHRRYQTQIRDSRLAPPQLMAAIKRDLNKPAPTTFARFEKVSGPPGEMVLGDEFVVRMPGPWDGPVRVIDLTAQSFRLATLAGHLEAGQIEFRVEAGEKAPLVFHIESWSRSGSRVVDVLYRHLRMAKEVQAHMWISFCEGVVKLSGGRMTGGISITTEQIEGGAGVC